MRGAVMYGPSCCGSRSRTAPSWPLRTSPPTTASRMLVEQLGTERAHFVDVDHAAGEYVVETEYHVPGATPIAGRFPIVDFASMTSALATGKGVVSSDATTDPAVGEATAQMEALAVRANITVPLLKGSAFGPRWPSTRRRPEPGPPTRSPSPERSRDAPGPRSSAPGPRPPCARANSA